MSPTRCFARSKRDEARRGATVQILHAEDASSIAGRILEMYQRLADTRRRGTSSAADLFAR
jgi:hypothetical protein